MIIKAHILISPNAEKGYIINVLIVSDIEYNMLISNGQPGILA